MASSTMLRTMSISSRFVLASGSPRRRELLTGLGITFDIIKPDVDESQHPGEAPFDYVRRLSRFKAETVAVGLRQPSAVLAADTVVVLAADTIGVDGAGEILGKPVDAADARTMLRRLRGRAHIVCTALTLLTVPDRREITELTYTTVHMRDYSDAEIDRYIASGDPFDKAGSYAIQNEMFHPVDRIEGSYTNVVGLPLETLKSMLTRLNNAVC
jgi:septum formation protein